MTSKEDTTIFLIKELIGKLLLLWSKDSEILKSIIVKNNKKIDLDATLLKIKDELKALI